MDKDIPCFCVECCFNKMLLHFAGEPLKYMSVFREDVSVLEAEEFIERMEERANTKERSLYFN